jgi:hypothetical protein
VTVWLNWVKSDGLTQPKKTYLHNIAHRRTPTQQLQTTSRIAELQLSNCKQHRASPNSNSTTAINIAHRRTPTLQLQSTSRLAEHQLYHCNQHRASPNSNSTTAINIVPRITQTLQMDAMFVSIWRCK